MTRAAFLFNMSNSNSVSAPGLTGRSSIPETGVLTCDVSGVLDARFRGHDKTRDVTQHSRGAIAPESLQEVTPSRHKEGAGKTGCCVHPQPRVQMKKAHELVHYRFTETLRPSLRDGLRLFASSPRCP
jgi:hypothetical protein